MILVQGTVDDTTLTGTIFEPGESPPQAPGSPDTGSPYVWVCDSFYQVSSGGQTQQIAGESIQVAFDPPQPKGFETEEAAITAAEEHLRTQFARVGVDRSDVDISTRDPQEAESTPNI